MTELIFALEFRGRAGAVPGARRGAVMWRVTGDEGRFAGAHGIITSNFAVGPEGEVVDNHFARIYVRDWAARA